MPHDRCIVGCSDNDKRHAGRMIVHSNVIDGKIVFHKLPLNEERRKAWIHAVTKGREDFEKPKHFNVCSSHFPEGKSTKCNPDPLSFLKISTNTMRAPTKPRPPPKKRYVSSSLADNFRLYPNSTKQHL